MPKRRLNGEGSIRRRQDGRYEVRISLGIDFATGKPKRISKYASTEEEAVQLLHELSFANSVSPNLFKEVTLGEWLEMCLEVYMKNTLKQSTYNSYRTYIEKHFKPALGEIPLSELTPRMLQLFYNYKTETEGLAPKTVVNINLFLHKALSFAVGEGYIRTNPAEALNLSRGQKPQIEILNRDEQAALMRGSYGHRYGVFVRLTLFTGLRLGELLGLRWEDVDVRNSMIRVQRTLGRLNKIKQFPGENTTEIVIGTPKSQNSLRTVPLIANIMQELLGWKAVQEQDRLAAGELYQDSGMIVTNPLGGFIEPRTFRDYYEQILAMSGLQHYTFHALRHTFATRAMEQGMDAKTLSMLLGHYSVSFTMDTYTHVQDKHKIEAMSLLDALYEEAAASKSYVYSVILTPQQSGGFAFTSPDFPHISMDNMEFTCGIQLMKDQISDEVLTSFSPPIPIPAEQIPLAPGQMIVQIAAT